MAQQVKANVSDLCSIPGTDMLSSDFHIHAIPLSHGYIDKCTNLFIFFLIFENFIYVYTEIQSYLSPFAPPFFSILFQHAPSYFLSYSFYNS